MIFNISGGGGSNAGLNFKVVGGNDRPVSPSENTIWVTPPQLLDFKTWAENVNLRWDKNGASSDLAVLEKEVSENYIILRAKGASDTADNTRVYTNMDNYSKIPCEAGKNYFITWDYTGSQGFVELYPSGLAADVIQISANTRGFMYTPKSGVDFFSISFCIYTSALQLTSGRFSNISIVEEATPIKEWIMSSENPYAYEVEVDYLKGKTTWDGYIGQYGDEMTQSTTNKEVCVEEYIPVKYGYNYTYNYTIASSKSMWLSIIEYTISTSATDRNRYFSKRIVPVNSVTGTVKTGTYSPSSSDVVAVRLAWRTFGLETTVEFKGTEEAADTSVNGAVWIHTNANSVVGFNALKKNDLEVYPVRAKQCVNGSWKELIGYSYQNGSWKQWLPYGALYWHGDLCEKVSGGVWTPKNLKTNSEVGDEFDLPTITYNYDHLLIDWRIAGWGGGAAKMLNSQDLTDVSLLQLEFEGEVLQNDADLFLSVYKKESVYHSDSVASIRIIDHAKGSPQTVGRRTVTLDVSSLSGEHYIRFFGWDSWSSSNSSIILKVYSLRKIYNE